MPINTGPGGDFQSEDPKAPFYIPPPPPKEAWEDTEIVIKTCEDWLAHPMSSTLDPNISKTDLEKIREAMARMEEEGARRRAEYEAGWLPKKALDDIVGADRDKWSKWAVVAVVRQYQMLVDVANKAGQPEPMVEAHRRRAVQELTRMCPEVPPDRLAKLLSYRLEQLCNDPTLRIPPRP
jgi:hypothetical protein